MAGPKSSEPQRDEPKQETYRVGWWDDTGNKGVSEALTEDEARTVVTAIRSEDHNLHAIALPTEKRR